MIDKALEIILAFIVFLVGPPIIVIVIAVIVALVSYQCDKDDKSTGDGTKTTEQKKPETESEKIERENNELLARHQRQYDHLSKMFYDGNYGNDFRRYVRYLKRKEARIAAVGKEQWRREANDDLHAMVSMLLDRPY